MYRDIFDGLNKQEAGQAVIPLCLSGFFFRLFMLLAALGQAFWL